LRAFHLFPGDYALLDTLSLEDARGAVTNVQLFASSNSGKAGLLLRAIHPQQPSDECVRWGRSLLAATAAAMTTTQ
jgi:hypothetical protein